MNKIINILKVKKSVPLDQFINIALYEKKFGYYMKKNPFGKEGDFITAPQISNLFGEMIGVWCVAFWEHLKKPKKISIVELGPGNGSLCINLLKTFKSFKDFYNCLDIILVEKSNILEKIQKTKIANKKVRWTSKIDQINYGPIIFICNEFFDSLPIKQLYLKKNSFFEKYITLSKDKNSIKTFYKKADKNLVKNIQKIDLVSRDKIIEYPMEAIKYLELISEKIKKFDGGLLAFDYGFTEKKGANTLQAIKKHKYNDIFTDPGNVDISSHINFWLFNKILKKNNLNVEKIITQNEFLQKMGILKRADILSKKMNFKDKANLYYRLKRLLDCKEMGSLFKVLFAKKKGKKFSLGF